MRPLKKEGTHVYLNLTELHFTTEIRVQRKNNDNKTFPLNTSNARSTLSSILKALKKSSQPWINKFHPKVLPKPNIIQRSRWMQHNHPIYLEP